MHTKGLAGGRGCMTKTGLCSEWTSLILRDQRPGPASASSLCAFAWTSCVCAGFPPVCKHGHLQRRACPAWSSVQADFPSDGTG